MGRHRAPARTACHQPELYSKTDVAQAEPSEHQGLTSGLLSSQLGSARSARSPCRAKNTFWPMPLLVRLKSFLTLVARSIAASDFQVKQ